MSESEKLLLRQIIESLRKGNVPVYGASRFYHTSPLIRRIIIEDLLFVKSGGYVSKYFWGKYGSGKTLTLTLIRDIAHDMQFATSFVTLDPRTVTINKLELFYQSILSNLSIRMGEELVESSEAVSTILDQWCRKSSDHRYPIQQAFPEAPGMTDILHSFTTRPELRTAIVEWVMGNAHVPFSKKQQFSVKGDIDRFSCMSYLNAFCRILQHVGYSGLAVLVDEVESTMQLLTKLARDAAYDNIRNLDENRYKIKNLYIAFGGTPEFFSDSERGVPSFQALNERISHHWEHIKRSHRSPIVLLDPIQKKDYFVILKKILTIYNGAYDSKIYLSDEMIYNSLDSATKMSSAPRDILREFIADLDQKAEQLQT
jgi:hypothetical protein